ncbi:MAG: glycosyltransferase family 4 protein [Chthoniobacterales bacterium]
MPPKPLRILVIVNLPWDSRLGASRVWIELAEQWRSAGHLVEKFSLSDAFPGVRAARVTFALRQIWFIRKAAVFVRKHGHRFDVIDALIGTLPYSKKELGFNGIIVARSVGLYRLYDRFEQSLHERWPRPAQGRFLGRLLYGFTRRRLREASERAVQKADLINVPNAEEAACLREEMRVHQPITVLPYGLTSERRRALAEAACPAEIRLAQKRICFVGMWGPRKGAHDWAAIIESVRRDVSQAKFRFLGTMLDADAIRADLGAAASEGVEFVSDYQPDELPGLLADCTVGAFPSYVEGFGLAVLEQLAAGVPTVAYDTAGPRDILRQKLPALLVPSGEIEKFAAALCGVLQLDAREYAELSKQSTTASAEFSWPVIAEQTLQSYWRCLEKRARRLVLFVQPFSLGSAGGGARILRALLEQAPFETQSVCCSPEKPKPWRDETHLPSRLSWGRIERSRLATLPRMTTVLFRGRFRRRLKRYATDVGARAIHAVPHAGLDFAEAHAVARELSLPFFISLHDDLAYTAADRVSMTKREAVMSEAWRGSSIRFVISDALGREYCRRYGERDFHIVTDGLMEVAAPRAPGSANALRIYFMGLFHMGYERNLRALLEGITLFERKHPSISVSVTLRCEHVRAQVLSGVKPVAILPFADEAQVQRDMEKADLLYMPMPFGREHENFARYSLSTKMVTYVGSGVPILYHGPASSAAFAMLKEHRAAFFIPTLSPEEIAEALFTIDLAARAQVALNALSLARKKFLLADQTRKFWGAISASLAAV